MEEEEERRKPRSASAIVTTFRHQRVVENRAHVIRAFGVCIYRLYAKAQELEPELDPRKYAKLLFLLDESGFPVSNSRTQRQETPLLAWNWIPVVTEMLMTEYVLDLTRALQTDMQEMATVLVIAQLFVVRHATLFSVKTVRLLVLFFFVLGHKTVQERALKTGDILRRCEEFMPLLDSDHVITVEFELFALIDYTIPVGDIYQTYLDSLYTVANENMPRDKRTGTPCIWKEGAGITTA